MQKQPHQTSLRPGISLGFKGDLPGSLWFHHISSYSLSCSLYEMFREYLDETDCQQTTLQSIWHWHQLEEWANASPDPLPGIHMSLLTFTWSSHCPWDKVVSGCCEKWCLWCSRAGSAKKEKTFHLDSAETGALEGIWECLLAQTTEVKGRY